MISDKYTIQLIFYERKKFDCEFME